MHIRLLTAQDGAAYQALRLKALQTNPRSFLADFEQESQRHEQSFSQELDACYSPPSFGYYGVWAGENDSQLIAFCQATRPYLTKQQHWSQLYNLYVDPEWRGKGIARDLILHITKQLKEHEHIEQIYISCLASNKPAYSLYQKLGFKRSGVRLRSSKWEGQYDDEVELTLPL